jgi:decaprenylphospho-beta-D-erythro-pentofuranosid-2-ulose 2-reductase
VLIIGATSAIATAVARRCAQRGARLALLARQLPLARDLAADLLVRGATEALPLPFDALDIEQQEPALAAAFAAFGGFESVLIAYGSLPDQAACEASLQAALQAFDLNARATVATLGLLAPRLQAQGFGVLGVIASPAGERGRASNYVYGASKAAVAAMASCLRHRLHAHGVRVTTVLPGFVDTPMTAGFDKSGPLWATPERVAQDIEAALERGPARVYTPWFWRWIMFIVRALPDAVFLKTRL